MLSQETGEIVEVRLRGLDGQGDIFDLGSERPSYYQVCDGRAYWLSLATRDGVETQEIRAWAPGGTVEVLYQSAPEEVVLGPVCEGDRIAFIKPVSGEIWAARVTGDTASPELKGETMSYIVPAWLIALVLMAIAIGAIAVGVAVLLAIRYWKR